VLAAATFGVTVGLTAIAPTVQTASACLVLVGGASIWFLATGNSTLQLASAPHMRGRVMALWTVAFIGTTPVGGPIVGYVAEHAGPRWALALGAAAAIAAAGLGALVLRRQGRSAPAE